MSPVRRSRKTRVITVQPIVKDETARQALANLRTGLVLTPAQTADIIEALVLENERLQSVLDGVTQKVDSIRARYVEPFNLLQYLRSEPEPARGIRRPTVSK